MTHEDLDAVIAFCDAAIVIAEARERQSLRHPDHYKLIDPLRKRARKLMQRLFTAQRNAILAEVRPWLKLHMREADDVPADQAKATAESIIPDTMTALQMKVSTSDVAEYSAIIQSAIERGAAKLEAELRSGAMIPENKLSAYLRTDSLGELTGGLDETTKQRLRDAIADTVQSGGTADDIVDAIDELFDDFNAKRANLIAQTEVNDAYNFGRLSIADAAGLDEKEWVTESESPCIICVTNEAQGYIPIGDSFISGDQIPTAHPGCYCGTDFRQIG